MIDTSFISSEPGNKSFDWDNIFCNLEEKKTTNDNSKNQLNKVCFNPYCNNRGNNLTQIIGTDTVFRDYRIPFCVCEECFLPFIGWGPGRDQNELVQSMPELKVCYNRSCNNRGRHWIDVYKNEIVERVYDGWRGGSVPYWLCERCYAFLEDKRRYFSYLFDKTFSDSRKEFGRETGEERYAITAEDFCILLESTKSSPQITKENRSDMHFTGPTTQTQVRDSGTN
jgi:hypothetical protein